MKERLTKIIYDWVAKNFGESEAEDPSWSIEALAEELDKHFHELYWQQELEYLKEDVDDYVDRNREYKLTEEQKYAVADRIRNSEWYCCINPEDMDYYVKDIIERSKNENN